ncbi:PLP-dependent aminotransferase family protein [Allokutzneria sp. A3M-2-11 16]|uniref:MocR-like pyridoxine biosynthesis transcription factor PdxR n=1 Tax=Allokutzneria sp. A3M-2-11 16 TaxID=2962043 RepID=UPI0020B8DF15|nr:PLP-dependent aminotransferase family protein [Allokutzneria sp. A3M-2-11 16]MCP3804050.1 PLP-dependent aminotransferase family protein [Allokutzneria sp. A3M-2-11 16]
MTETWTGSGLELPIALDRDGPGSLATRLRDALREAVRAGRVRPGARLPSTRTLAADLRLSRGTVVEAYRRLIAEGYFVASGGSGTRVAAVGAAPPPPVPARELRWDFRPSVPDLALFPRTAWSKTFVHTLRHVPDSAFGYGDPRGVLELRTELANYLRRVRDVRAAPDRIVVCSGFTQALTLVCRVLAARGEWAVESPGSTAAWARITGNGIHCRPVPLDDRGLSVDALAATGAGVALVTPAHQFPTGVTLAPGRRAELLAWATAGGLVIEDDYDAEFRYDHEPIGALQGSAPERVIYAGSVSKTLAPSLRLGWLVLPGALVDEVAEAKRLDDMGCPALDQHAFAHFLASGAYDRHLRRARRKYRSRRDVLVAELGKQLPRFRVRGIAAGLQAQVTLPDGLEERAIAEAARKRGVGVYPLSDYLLDTGGAEQGLVLGYGRLSELEIAAGIARLSDAVA